MTDLKKLYQSELPGRAIAVYLYLRGRANKEGVCWPAIPTMARELKMSESTIGPNPQSDPRIFPGIPGFSRSLTHSLTRKLVYRPTLFACSRIPKKPEATGSAGRCDPGVGDSPTHTLSPAYFSHPLLWPYSGIFQPCPHGAIFGFFGLGRVVSPSCGEPPHTGPHGAQQAGAGFLSGGEHIRTGLLCLILGGISVLQEFPDGGRHMALVKT